MKDFHPVRFHLTDEELAESDMALADVGGKRGSLAKRLFMERVRGLNAEKNPGKKAKAKK